MKVRAELHLDIHAVSEFYATALLLMPISEMCLAHARIGLEGLSQQISLEKCAYLCMGGTQIHVSRDLAGSLCANGIRRYMRWLVSYKVVVAIRFHFCKCFKQLYIFCALDFLIWLHYVGLDIHDFWKP